MISRKMAAPDTFAVVGALVAIVAIVAAAVLFSTGQDSLERLAVLVGVVGLIIPSLTGSLSASQAARSAHVASEQTNGTLDGRIADAVSAALQARRVTDTVIVAQSPRIDPVTVDRTLGQGKVTQLPEDGGLTEGPA